MPKRLIKFFISALVFTYDQAERLLLRAVRIPPPGRCVVLYYHGITDQQREKFSRQIRYLLQFATPVSALFHGTLERKKYHFALTFDDALESFVRNALPIIRNYRLPAVLFVPSGLMGKQPCWDVLDEQEGGGEKVLGPSQIKELDPNLVTIGSHSVSHPFFPKLTNEDARVEISESKKELEQLIGRPVQAFSFPYGAFAAQHVEFAREAGYQRLFTTRPTVATGQMNDFVLGRIDVKPTDWMVETYLKVQGAYRWLPAASKLKGAGRSLIRRLTN